MSIHISCLYGCQIFIFSLVLTYWVLPKMYLFANKIGLLDYPNKRKVHIVGKPLIGGLAIAVSLTISSILFIETKQIHGYYLGMFLVLLIGFFDDYRDLNPKWKLLAQMVTAIVVVLVGQVTLLSFGNILSFGAVSFGIFAIPVTIFCIVGVINATNMLDGVDGLVGVVSAIVFISFGILAYINNQPLYLLLSIALCGCVFAFLRYNWYPSLLFLGDAGSFLLGFSMVFLSIVISQKQNSVVPPVVPLLILVIPIVDISTVFIRRIICRRSPFSADKTHFHHILLRLGFKKKHVVLVAALITAIFSTLGIVGTIYKIPEHYLFLLFLAYFATHLTLSLSARKFIRFKDVGKKGWHSVRAQSLPVQHIRKTIKINNKRSSERNMKCLGISCKIESNSRKLSCTSELINIGFDGFSAKLDQFLVHCEHEINFVLPVGDDDYADLSATAEIVWMKRDNGHFMYGFKFTDMELSQRGILKCYL
ncbi:MAG: hypothetical protein GY777_22135 [Candidatus Brocadiaceae bacterium]|nr:hypothetical protein [Candidatus Brocadiaceae bacterium]